MSTVSIGILFNEMHNIVIVCCSILSKDDICLPLYMVYAETVIYPLSIVVKYSIMRHK